MTKAISSEVLKNNFIDVLKFFGVDSFLSISNLDRNCIIVFWMIWTMALYARSAESIDFYDGAILDFEKILHPTLDTISH
jgi:hypothetical protein